MPVKWNKIPCALVNSGSTAANRLSLQCKEAEHVIPHPKGSSTNDSFFGQFSNAPVIIQLLEFASSCLCQHCGMHTSQKSTTVLCH